VKHETRQVSLRIGLIPHRFCRNCTPNTPVSILPSASPEFMRMLRIITEQRGRTFFLALHGTLDDEGIAVLDEHWQSILEKSPAAMVKVDLANVTFIDPHGERLLRQMVQRGVEFHAAGLLNQYVIERIAGGM
jgi:hypothetical protein